MLKRPFFWIGFLAGVVGLALTAGCAGMSTSEDTKSPGSMMMMPGGGMPPRPDGGMMPPPDGGMMPPPDGMMGPKTCTTDDECTTACPPGSKGCKCVSGPMMGTQKICVPTCTMNSDCPTPPMGTLQCDTQQGICVPA